MPLKSLTGEIVRTPSPKRQPAAKPKAKRKGVKAAKAEEAASPSFVTAVDDALFGEPLNPESDPTAAGSGGAALLAIGDVDAADAAAGAAPVDAPVDAPVETAAQAAAAPETAPVDQPETAAVVQPAAETAPVEQPPCTKPQNVMEPAMNELTPGAQKMLAQKGCHSFPPLEMPGSCTQAACKRCKKPVDPIKKGVRLVKKTHPQEWQCPECNSKLVTLTNLFGSWPIEAYHSLSDLEKTSFWQQSSSGRQALKEAVEQKIVFKQIKQLVDSNVGKFLPMEAWVRKGWTPEAVAKCPTEIHPSGEKTY